MGTEIRKIQRRGRHVPNYRRTRATPYLTCLLEKRPNNNYQLHAGIARHGIGIPFCDDTATIGLEEMPIFARDPRYALTEGDGVRHRYTEAALELNRGCKPCLDQLYAISREMGWAEPKDLKSPGGVRDFTGMRNRG